MVWFEPGRHRRLSAMEKPGRSWNWAETRYPKGERWEGENFGCNKECVIYWSLIMEQENSYIHDGKLERNALLVGGTDCGKTTLVQRLAVVNLFGERKTTEWVPQIELPKSREAELQSCFSPTVKFLLSHE